MEVPKQLIDDALEFIELHYAEATGKEAISAFLGLIEEYRKNLLTFQEFKKKYFSIKLVI